MIHTVVALGLMAGAGCDIQMLVGALTDAGTRPPPSTPPTPPPVVHAGTEVKDCPGYNTLGKMDVFFAMRCGMDAVCHASSIPWTDFKSPGVWSRLLDARPRAACIRGTEGRIIDSRNWRNSILLTKVQIPAYCPPGTAPIAAGDAGPGTENPGFTMPPADDLGGAAQTKQPPLTMQERICIENFVRAATGN